MQPQQVKDLAAACSLIADGAREFLGKTFQQAKALYSFEGVERVEFTFKVHFDPAGHEVEGTVELYQHEPGTEGETR